MFQAKAHQVQRFIYDYSKRDQNVNKERIFIYQVCIAWAYPVSKLFSDYDEIQFLTLLPSYPISNFL